MPTLYVGNVPDDLYEALRSRARENGKSISAALLELFAENVPTPAELARRRAFAQRAKRIRERNSGAGGPFPTAEEMVREAKWFLPSSDQTLLEESLTLLEGHVSGRVRLLVPDLFWPEIGNIFWKAVRSGRMSRDSAEAAIDLALKHMIPTTRSLPLVAGAFSLAASSQRSFYDAIYVALAVSLRAGALPVQRKFCTLLKFCLPVLFVFIRVHSWPLAFSSAPHHFSRIYS
jgi:predicted nucleic acid-binding protein